MNKHVIEVLNRYDFQIDKHLAYGFINDYEVNVFEGPMTNGPIFFFSTYLNDVKKQLFVTQIKQRKLSMVQANYFEFGVFVIIGAMSGKGFAKKYDEVMGIILSTLESLEAPKKDICPLTGVELDEENSNINYLNNGVKIKMTHEALNDINKKIEQVNEDFVNAPNNYLRGFLGILLGALTGLVISIILNYLGFVSSVSSIVSIFFGIFLYKKFGGKPNGVMIAMSLITTLIFMVGFVLIIYMLFANAYMQEAHMDLVWFDAFLYLLSKNSDFASSFRHDILMYGLFYAIAAGVSIFSLINSIKRPKTINQNQQQ